MSELELKFQIPEHALPSLRAALLAHGAQRTRLRARYFDTADGLLARHLVALRLRLEGRHWVQTLKAAGAGAVHRLEHEVRVPGGAAKLPALDLQRHAGSEADRALQAALQAMPGAVLVERHATDITRLHGLLSTDEGTLVEVALDIGRAMAGGRWASITELELEHKGGPVRGLFSLAEAWVHHGGLWLSTITKAERGQRLMVEPEQAPRTATHRPGKPGKPGKAGKAGRSAKPGFDGAADGPALLPVLLQGTLAEVLEPATDVAEGDSAAETIHRLRVALRRLRTVLRELPALSTHISPAWDAALSHTFGELGPTRDQQAVADTVRPLLQAARAPRLQWQARPAPDPGAAVRAPDFQATLVAILGLAHAEPACFAALSNAQLRALVSDRLDTLHGQVTRGGRRFLRLPAAQQHRVRKRLKSLRYLIELTLPLWPEREVKPCLKQLARAQKALGLHNDVAVAAAAFRDDATLHPEAWFAAGWLQAHLAVTARGAHRALREVAQGGRFWA